MGIDEETRETDDSRGGETNRGGKRIGKTAETPQRGYGYKGARHGALQGGTRWLGLRTEEEGDWEGDDGGDPHSGAYG